MILAKGSYLVSKTYNLWFNEAWIPGEHHSVKLRCFIKKMLTIMWEIPQTSLRGLIYSGPEKMKEVPGEPPDVLDFPSPCQSVLIILFFHLFSKTRLWLRFMTCMSLNW